MKKICKSSFAWLFLMACAQIAMAAGPYRLAPQEVQGGIPTWGFGRHTKVIIHCKADGNFEMTCAGSPTEVNHCREGRNQFERNFGGGHLSIKNLTREDVTVYTE